VTRRRIAPRLLLEGRSCSNLRVPGILSAPDRLRTRTSSQPFWRSQNRHLCAVNGNLQVTDGHHGLANGANADVPILWYMDEDLCRQRQLVWLTPVPAASSCRVEAVRDTGLPGSAVVVELRDAIVLAVAWILADHERLVPTS
jgi:hypothetical protein